MSLNDIDLEMGFMWIVARIAPNPNKGHNDYFIQGIFSTEQKAIDACLDETYFIGPLPVDTILPEKRMEWVGLYFPLKNER